MEKKEKKTIYILIAVLVVFVIAGGILLKGKTKESAVTVEGNTATTDQAGNAILGAEALRTISLIDSLKINDTLLSRTDFLGLVDISVSPQTEKIGRANPFAPI